MYCSSSLMAAYPKMGPSLSDSVYPPPTSYTAVAQPYMTFASEASAFYSPMVSSWANSDNLDSWRTLSHHSTWPYDSSMSAYPYTPSYGGLDVRRKNATRESTSTLKAWLYEHIKNPYPTKGEKIMLAIITKMTLTQVSTWFANARRRLKKENKMQWSPRNRTGDDDDDKSLASDSENTASDNNSGTNSNANNKDCRHNKEKIDDGEDKIHLEEDETIVVDNIIGDDVLMSVSDRRKLTSSTLGRGSGNDVTSYLACSSLPPSKLNSMSSDSQRNSANRFISSSSFPDHHHNQPQQQRVLTSQQLRQFPQSISLPSCGNIGLSLPSSSPSSSSSSSFYSSSPLPPYNIFSQPPSGTNFYPHPSFMHGFPPSYCGTSGGVFGGRDYACSGNRSLFNHNYKPVTPCGTESQMSSTDSSLPFSTLTNPMPGMMSSSIEGGSKPRIWSLADVATSVGGEPAVTSLATASFSTSDAMFGLHFSPYFSTPTGNSAEESDKRTSASSHSFKDAKNDSIDEEYSNVVVPAAERRLNSSDKLLKTQMISPLDRYHHQYPSCSISYNSNSCNFPFSTDRSFSRRGEYSNNINCSSSSSSSSSSSCSSFSLFPSPFFNNINSAVNVNNTNSNNNNNNEMFSSNHNNASPNFFQPPSFNDDDTPIDREITYRGEKVKSKI